MLLINILTLATLTSFGSVAAIPAPDSLPRDVVPYQVTHAECNMGKTTTVMETVTVDPAAGTAGTVITSAVTTATDAATANPAATSSIIGPNNIPNNDTTIPGVPGSNDTAAAVGAGAGTNETAPANGTEAAHKRVVGGYIASWGEPCFCSPFP